jgi:dihydroneopterin triphosphate diphosphatase
MSREFSIRSNSVSVVVVRLRIGIAEYLLLRRATDYLRDQWCQVAGAVEEGETAWQAGVRELKEETGLEPLSLYSADRFEQFYRPDWDALVLVPLFVAFVSADSGVRLNPEHSDYRWCRAKEALGILPFYSQRENISHVQAEFIERQPCQLARILPKSL